MLFIFCFQIGIQKHPSIGVLIKTCSENMQQIYRRTAMPKYDFNKVPKHLFRTYFHKNKSWGLLLWILVINNKKWQ